MFPLILGLHFLIKCFEATWFTRMWAHCAAVPCIEPTALPEQCRTQQAIMVHPDSGTQRATLTFCSQILRSVVLQYCLYSPVIPAWIIRSPKSTFPSSTLQLPQEGELLTTCCFACWQTWICLFNFPKTPKLLTLLQTQKAEQRPGLTDRCGSRLRLKKTKLHHNLPYKRVSSFTVELYSVNSHQHCLSRLMAVKDKKQLHTLDRKSVV